MSLRDTAIVAYAETKVMDKSDRDIWVLDAEIPIEFGLACRSNHRPIKPPDHFAVFPSAAQKTENCHNALLTIANLSIPSKETRESLPRMRGTA